jgi:hypothetical protein
MSTGTTNRKRENSVYKDSLVALCAGVLCRRGSRFEIALTFIERKYLIWEQNSFILFQLGC